VFAETDDVLEVAILEPSTLDPMRIQDPGSVLVARQIFESLTRWDPVGEEVLPAAAESWKVTNGGRTFTFKLVQGAAFHNGDPVTSKDFAYAFDRIAQKQSGSELAYTLERVQGFTQVNGLGNSNHLSGIKTPDDLTLSITLSEPFYDFPAVLTHPGLVPLKKSEVEKNFDSFLRSPVGNGPFEIAEPWNPGEIVTMRAFAGAIDTPSLDGIRFYPFPDAAASWLRFVDGEFDVSEVPAGQIEAAAEQYGDQGFKPLLAGYYFGFNLRAPSLQNVTLRRAVSRGIDRATIASQIYKGTLGAPRGIVPEGMPGFEENVCGELCRYAPEASAELVQAFPKKRRKLRLEYTAGPPHDQVAQAVKANLEAIGLDITLKGYGFKRYLQNLDKGKQEIYRLGWIAEYPVPDVFLSSLFGSGAPDNHSRFRSDKVDRLLEEAHAEKSLGRRQQLYIQAEKAIMRKVPIVPLGSFITHWVAQPNVQGIQFDVMGGFDAQSVTLGE
jgi:oligopeptide transport system substrate-binding protein